MKVELDLSTEQLNQLDEDLSGLLKNLTEDQKIEIVKGYINYQFDKLTYTYHTSWGDQREELSNFGKELIAGLQDKISQSVKDDIMKDENLQKAIKDNVDGVIRNLDNIIRSSISQYIINNLFSNKEEIECQMRNEMYQFMNNNRGRFQI